MKKCTYCGKEYPDEATVCTVDHQPLVPDGQLAAQSSAAAMPSAKYSDSTAPTRAIKPALMTRLRSWHLYLGCIFAPMLLLFALTGIWQTLGIRGTKWMSVLSAIHTSRKTKNGMGFSTPLLKVFIVMMSIAFIITTILGIIMAVKYGRNRRVAYYCLAFGIIFPLLLIVIQFIR
jgi:hypothetical protein